MVGTARGRREEVRLAVANGKPGSPSPPITWHDALPWLDTIMRDGLAEVAEDDRWWRQPVEASDGRDRRRRLTEVSEIATRRLGRWNVGQIFPTIPPDAPLADLNVITRARNIFARMGYQVVGDIQSVDLADMLAWPQAGVGTVDNICQALAEAATQYRWTPSPSGQGTTASASLDLSDVAAEQDLAAPVVDDLRLMASWLVTAGLSDRRLFEPSMPPGTPPSVVAAAERLHQLTGSAMLSTQQLEHNVSVLLDLAVGSLDERDQEMLARRFFADQPETLDQLGREMGITRERVRQIEARNRSKLAELIEPGGPLDDIAGAARELVEPVLPLSQLLQMLPGLAAPVCSVQQPGWRVLDRIDDYYEIEDGWCVAPTITTAKAATQTRLAEIANSHGVASIADYGPLNPSLTPAADAEALRQWIEYCGYVVRGDQVLVRTRSIDDWAAAILSIEGRPMPAQEILDRAGVDRSLGSLKNAMAADDRFERVDRDSWALREWGIASYAGVKALIREEIVKAGGSVLLETLISRLTGTYSVSASSIVTYANAAPFVTKSGYVELHAGDRVHRKSPERTRRLYRRGDDWLYRVRITTDHQRGSGFVAPVAIAGVLDLSPGLSVQLDSALGPQTIGFRGSQPSFGSIRRFLIKHDVATDREVLLVLGSGGTFDIEVLPESAETRVSRALSLVGADPEADDPRQALALAIGLPAESPFTSVIGGYRERGDSDVVELLIESRSELDGEIPAMSPVAAAHVADILDLL